MEKTEMQSISNQYLGVRLPSTLLEQLKDYCDHQDLNQSQVVRRSLSQYLKEKNEALRQQSSAEGRPTSWFCETE
jgi:metal-responsive CopG/Arc/MetJ family transcriptional regulator